MTVIPELPDHTVAKIGDKYILKEDYKAWLYRKIGFEPPRRERFVLHLALDKYLRERGIDPDRQKQIMIDNFFDFNRSGLSTSASEWIEMKEERSNRGLTEPADYRSEIMPMVEDNYLGALYVMENWDELYEAGPRDFGAPDGLFDVQGGTAETRHIVHLNNALKMYNQYYSIISPIMREEVLAGMDMNIPDHVDEYKDWIYDRYDTVFLLENYLGMIISGMNAEKHDLQIVEEVAQQEFDLRVEDYQAELDAFNRYLPDTCIEMELTPVYADYIMEEVRDDLYKSRAYRNERPMKPHQIALRFYKEYGYEGQRIEAEEIFKWVRRRNSAQARTQDRQPAEEEAARIRNELNDLREQILAEGKESFYQHAITENYLGSLQRNAGRIDMDGDLSEFYAEHAEKLSDLSVNEISPVLEGPGSALSILWIVGVEWNGRVIHAISQHAPVDVNFDYLSYRDDLASAHDQLVDLKSRIENGQSITELAKEHSDNFRSTGGDISDIYEQNYGYAFAKELKSVPEGGLKIIKSNNGLHLVQVHARTETELTDDIRNRIITDYNRELADQQERYVIIKKLLHEYDPYF